MAILLSSEILDTLHQELQNADKSVQIISAYCKEKTIVQLNKMIPSTVDDRRLMVRFRLDDILKGSSDFTAAEYCLKNGWKVFLRFDLHVKTYVVDYPRGIVGSANATNSGLGMSKVPNLEMATLVDMDSEDIKKINKLYEQAVPVDIELLELMKAEIENVNNEKTSESFSWSQDIAKRFNPTIETLFSHELPETDTIDGYLQFLDADFGGDKTSIKNVFRWSTSYLWLLQTVKGHDGEIYFGELSSILHNTIVSDPKPYRKDVKLLLANLLSIVEELDMDELIIDRPSHSQRVRLAK